MAPITAAWALWGKQPGTGDEDAVLAHGQGPFSRDEYATIIARYAPGFTADLPQVTMSWVSDGSALYTGMAVQEWSHHRDAFGRNIPVTRYFCVPFARLAEGPAAYAGLYEALGGCALPADGPLEVQVSALDPRATADAAGAKAMEAAALLVTGDPVCVVGAEAEPLEARLRFLDAVTSLLPYGFRSRLTASTWTDAASHHRIALSFARHAPAGAHAVSWTGEADAEGLPQVARRYMTALAACGDLAEAVERFARDTRPRPMKAADLAGVADSIADLDATRAARRESAADLLRACADSIAQGDARRLTRTLDALAAVARGPRPADRGRDLRRIIADRRVFVAARALDSATEERLYDVLLPLAYGPRLTLEGFEEIRGNAEHWLPPPLAAAMRRMSAAEPAVVLRLVRYLDRGEAAPLLSALPAEALVEAALREPLDPASVYAMCGELAARGADPAERAPIGEALRRRGHLAAVVHRLHPADPENQIRRFHTLLTAAYGPVLDRPTVEKEFLSQTGAPSASLLAAVSGMCAPEARQELLEWVFADLLRQAEIGEETLKRGLSPAPPPDGPQGPLPPADRGATRLLGLRRRRS
ncbi:hypothetical protein Ssi03_60900 [Sphaerisporangium siamense]|uniref:Plasmid stabilization system protein ParE n=1 Tax=Sphaerisporangium siamense TaxID=795645 RepID=A0A7W7DB22_9ACTN|nr:hypothetical protein [Sphaerisporangium siamense]MBB4703321.1 plasmid stabilization system protein ParE [Sphaerisporangium siamense]GII88100.1 hypothetical protein Ssi03_60900 [Sphaerisporangium siamense]